MRSLPRGRAADRRATILRGSESRSTPPCAAPIRRVAPLEPLANVLLYRRARRLANRAELGIGLPCGPAIAFGEPAAKPIIERQVRSEEHTSELQSLMRISYAVLCLKKKKISTTYQTHKP